MANLIQWFLIIGANALSILCGFYCVYKIISAFLNHHDLMKYQGYFISAFFCLLIFPLIITIGGLKIADFGKNNSPVIVAININDLRTTNDNVYFSSNNYVFDMNSKNTINLNINNQFNEEKEFNIAISCINDGNKCDDIINILIPEKKVFQIEPKIIFVLPIKVNIYDDLPKGKYDFNITINDDNNQNYDSIPLVIIVD
jgi:hypothetical protein